MSITMTKLNRNNLVFKWFLVIVVLNEFADLDSNFFWRLSDGCNLFSQIQKTSSTIVPDDFDVFGNASFASFNVKNDLGCYSITNREDTINLGVVAYDVVNIGRYEYVVTEWVLDIQGIRKTVRLQFIKETEPTLADFGFDTRVFTLGIIADDGPRVSLPCSYRS